MPIKRTEVCVRDCCIKIRSQTRRQLPHQTPPGHMEVVQMVLKSHGCEIELFRSVDSSHNPPPFLLGAEPLHQHIDFVWNQQIVSRCTQIDGRCFFRVFFGPDNAAPFKIMRVDQRNRAVSGLTVKKGERSEINDSTGRDGESQVEKMRWKSFDSLSHVMGILAIDYINDKIMITGVKHFPCWRNALR